jgi:hypothetical protein
MLTLAENFLEKFIISQGIPLAMDQLLSQTEAAQLQTIQLLIHLLQSSYRDKVLELGLGDKIKLLEKHGTISSQLQCIC